MNPKQLIAHRGDNTHYPENTLVAIEAALKAGATAFEFDVQMNADQSLIAFHDDDFVRMTENNHTIIYTATDAELADISIHQPQKFGQQHKPTTVTYVDEIVELLRQNPQATAYVEIKEGSINYWGLETVMKKLVNSFTGLENQAVIISFSSAALAYTKVHSKLKIGLVFEEYTGAIKQTAEHLSPEYLICSYDILPENHVWQGAWQWMVYTVNDLTLASRLLKRGDIDFIETDDIQLFLNA